MPKIIVETGVDVFVFIKNHEQLTLNTFVYLNTGGARAKILSVGEEPVGSHDSLRVDLFSHSDKNVVPGMREELIASFLRHAFAQLTGRMALLRPIVYFKGTAQLQPVLGDRVNEILRQSSIQAGAAEIHFDSLVFD
jgi:hypothetical protein